jgi:hypothetical protein
MTKEFLEIVLTELINERDICKMEMNTIFMKDSSVKDKVKTFRENLTEFNKLKQEIEILSGMIPQDNNLKEEE